MPAISFPDIVQGLEGVGQELINNAPQIAIMGCVILGIAVIADWVSNQSYTKGNCQVDVGAKLHSIGLSRTRNRNNSFSITIQAQGTGVYQNIRKGSTQGSKVLQVFSDKPITKNQALMALSILYSQLSPNEQTNMNDRFTEAKEWIESQPCGFAGFYKSIQPKINPSGNRIDMIFKGGYNLVPDN